MNLAAVRLANFKAFGASQRIPLRPITLLYGANSAGKSSVLHGLALSHHAIETGDLDTQRTTIGGESIDLGGFRQYRHRYGRRERGKSFGLAEVRLRNRHGWSPAEEEVVLGFEMDPTRLSGRVAGLLRSARNVVVELSVGGPARASRADAGVDAGQTEEREVRLQRFELEVDDEPLLTMSVRPGGLLRLDSLDHGNPVFRDLFRGILTLATTTDRIDEDDFAALGDVLDTLVPSITARRRGLFPRVEDEADGDNGERDGWQAMVPVSRGRRREDLASAARLFLPRALRELVDGVGAAVEADVKQLRYLGPLRSYPPRHLAFAQHHDSNWHAGGGHAWDLVRTREDVRQRVNAWLGDADRLQTPYELEVRDLLPASVVSENLPEKLDQALVDLSIKLENERAPQLVEIFSAVNEGYALGEELTEMLWELYGAEIRSKRWAGELVRESLDALQDLVLIDKRTGAPVSHRDVGIGVSQVLPVLVSAYAWKDSLLAIEQPEIHLHPALQAELGDVFVQSALGSGNTFIIETHSEHLLLRIMRRIRETSSGELKEGVPAVRPEDVMVLFVDPDGPQSIVREMPLNERGELVKAWPGGFFEEGLREIF